MAPERSRSITVCQSDSVLGLTQPSSVMAPPRSSEALAGIVTQFVPAKVSAEPNLPAAVRVAPVIVPLLCALEVSVTVVPLASSKPQAPTMPVGSTAGLLTVIATEAEVVVLPASSFAVAVSVCGPFAVPKLSQENWYGAVVRSAPSGSPSSLNWTPATPTLSAAVAVSVVVPWMVAPAAGAVTDTVGAVVSGGGGSTVVKVHV